MLRARFGWHPLDVEDVLSKRQRPKVDEYPDYLFAVLHFPFYDKAVQRLNAAELDVFLGQGYLAGFGMSIGTTFGRIAGEEAAHHVRG